MCHVTRKSCPDCQTPMYFMHPCAYAPSDTMACANSIETGTVKAMLCMQCKEKRGRGCDTQRSMGTLDWAWEIEEVDAHTPATRWPA